MSVTIRLERSGDRDSVDVERLACGSDEEPAAFGPPPVEARAGAA